ncbi:MAG: hypothetical protein DWQ04_34170 [Chloroflexi bacterium]|nr:MAG: hypothetical protein DWQ04_34170 [Chloroflexota bacterium]
MFDLLRDLTKSAEEKRQEQITAYVDGELSPRERQHFEQLMADDPGLQAEVADLQQFKQNLRQLPRRRVPRNFTLDPARYQMPQRQPLLQLYPAMRVATVLTAVFLIIAVSAELLTFGGALENSTASEPVAMQSAPADEAAMDTAADSAMEEMAVEEEAVEEETITFEAAEPVELAEEAPAEEVAAEPEIEIAAEVEVESEIEVIEAEEVAEEALPEEPAPAPEQTARATPVKIDPQLDTMTSEGESMDDGAENAAAGSDAPAAALAPTPSPVGTQAPDTPRIQPTPTLADRVIKTQPAATEIALESVEIGVVEQDEDAETAVSIPHIQTPRPLSDLRIIQIMLAGLLGVLGTAGWYTRRPQ